MNPLPSKIAEQIIYEETRTFTLTARLDSIFVSGATQYEEGPHAASEIGIGWGDPYPLSGAPQPPWRIELHGSGHIAKAPYYVPWAYTGLVKMDDIGLDVEVTSGYTGDYGEATLTVEIPLVWVIVTYEYVDHDDGDALLPYPPSLLDSGAPWRMCAIESRIDTRAGKTFTASASVLGSSDSVTGDTADFWSDFPTMAMFLGVEGDGSYEEIEAGVPTLDDDQPVASVTFNQTVGFTGMDYAEDNFQVTGGTSGVTVTTNDVEGNGSWQMWGQSSFVVDYSVTGDFYRGDQQHAGTIDVNDCSDEDGSPDPLETDATFDLQIPAALAYWYPDNLSPTRIHEYSYDEYQIGPFRVDDTWLTSAGYDSTDQRIMLRDRSDEWRSVLTLQQASTYTITPFADTDGWDTVSDCVSTYDADGLVVTVSSAGASCANTAALYVIRHRRYLRMRVKGPLGTFTFGMTVGGEAKTWTVDLTVADTWQEHLIDLMQPNEGVWFGPNAPRHTSHSSGAPIDDAYTIGLYDLREGVYHLDWIKEEQTTDGTHKALARVCIPASWMIDYNDGADDHYLSRNLDVFSQGLGSPAHWWKRGTTETDGSRENHFGSIATRIESGNPSFVTVADYVDALDAGMTSQGYTVTENNASETGDVYANSALLAAWILEYDNVDITSAKTFMAAVQADRWLVMAGFPEAIELTFFKRYGSQFEGYVQTVDLGGDESIIDGGTPSDPPAAILTGGTPSIVPVNVYDGGVP